jgi:hypothetical protein
MNANVSVHRYRAFSVEVESELPLPELKTSAGRPDVIIRLGTAPKFKNSSLSERCVNANEDEVHLYWEGAGSFVMRGGTEMVVEPIANVEEALLRTGILGPGFATILQQRGNLVLHASAVVIDGKAVAFIGWKGQGKSTLAATLFARGYPLLTDDLLLLNGKDGQVMAHPGFPQFKLWPDSAQCSLSESPEGMPKLMSDCEKRLRPVTDGFASGPARLCAIYVLANGSELMATRLTPQETFKQIVSNTFCARYGSRVFDGQIGRTHLQNVAKIVTDVPVFKLERPSSLAKLGQLAEFVVQTFRGVEFK